jgi:hypothetical protein
MHLKVIDGSIFIRHGAREVSEAQVARSPVLAELCALEGGAHVPVDEHVFHLWQEIAEDEIIDLEVGAEDACKLFEVRRTRLRNSIRGRTPGSGTADTTGTNVYNLSSIPCFQYPCLLWCLPRLAAQKPSFVLLRQMLNPFLCCAAFTCLLIGTPMRRILASACTVITACLTPSACVRTRRCGGATSSTCTRVHAVQLAGCSGCCSPGPAVRAAVGGEFGGGKQLQARVGDLQLGCR